MKKLPLGVNDFKKIRSENYIYVDKTRFVYDLVTNGEYYFLSRPRRFGKTLLVDTLRRLFEGRKELFEGLYVYDKWDWGKKFPVIKIDFSSGDVQSVDALKEVIIDNIEDHKKKYSVDFPDSDQMGLLLKKLVVSLFEKYNSQVVILIDEYDKPILDNITDRELARKLRRILSDFYGVIKGLDEYVRFVFLTGVSKFSKVNLFSKLNNLSDITLNRKYSTICGYTESELDKYFSDFLAGVNREEVREWYNGYSWLGERVYNPFDILQLIDNEFFFKNYWWETGTPTFLIELMRENRYFIPDLEEIEATDEILGSFDVDYIAVEALMWQTGYLTIKGTKRVGPRTYYKLSYPNLEVKMSLNDVILNYLSSLRENTKSRLGEECYNSLASGDVEKFIEVMKRLLASLPYTSYTKNEIAKYEGYYINVIYSFLASLGLDITAEDITNKGRIDLTIRVEGKIYVLELKMSRIGEDPLSQVREKKYYEKYVGKGEIYLVGLVISDEERNVVKFEWEKVKLL